MATIHRKRLPPEILASIEAKTFLQAFGLVTLAGGLAPQVGTHSSAVLAKPAPQVFPAFYEMETDPQKRAILAAIEFFGFDEAGCQGFLLRFRSLVKFLADGKLSDWMIRDPRNPEVEGVHQAVLLAAASEPLNEEGEFSLESLLARVQDIAARIDPRVAKVN